MTDQLRFGVIGTNWMQVTHIKAINSHPRAVVHVIFGRDSRKASSVARDLGVPHVATDYRELIARDDLGAVVVGAPDYLHHEMVVSAAQQGLHGRSLDDAGLPMASTEDARACGGAPTSVEEPIEPNPEIDVVWRRLDVGEMVIEAEAPGTNAFTEDQG